VTHPDVVANSAGGDREAVPATAPLQVAALRGPFGTVSAFCETTEDRSCAPFDVELPQSKPVSAPFDDAVYLAVGVEGFSDCYLGMRVDSQWYFRTVAESCKYEDSRSLMEVVGATLYSEALLSSGTQLVLEYTIEETFSNMDNDGIHREGRRTAMILCGVGPSGVPTCADELVIDSSWSETPVDAVVGGPKTTTGSWGVDIDFNGDMLTVVSEAEGAADRVGDHTLVFP
jgi:hypothetical protein